MELEEKNQPKIKDGIGGKKSSQLEGKVSPKQGKMAQ